MMDRHEGGALEPGGETLQTSGELGTRGGDGGGVTHKERHKRATRWNMEHTRVLITAMEDRDARMRDKSTDFIKWSIVEDYCKQNDVHRSSSQCKKRWHSLYTEYKKIKEYERENEAAPYWDMSADERREWTLPPMFERAVFDRMDNFLSQIPKLSVTDDATFGSGADLDVPEPHSEGSSKRKEGAGSEKIHRASRWTKDETLSLILAKKTEICDEQNAPKKGRALQENKKWAAIARFCNEGGVRRDSTQCKKRWHSLYTRFKKIKQHEQRPEVESYWEMSVEKRREYNLAPMFERVFYDRLNESSLKLQKVVPDNDHPSRVRELGPAPCEPIPEVGENENNSSHQGSPTESGGFGSTACGGGHKKRPRRQVSSCDDMLEQKLVAVLEKNGKAIRAELAAHRELQKEQGRQLIAVIKNGFEQIASAIHKLPSHDPVLRG